MPENRVIEKNVAGGPSGGRLLDALAALIARRESPRLSYAVAVFLTAIALAVRLWIAPLDGGIQYVTFFPAVALAAVFGGLRSGLLTAALGAALATYLFWPPYQAFTFEFRHATVLSNTVFLIDAVLVSVSVEAMHRYYRRYVDAEQELRLAASVFENSFEGVMVTDAAGVIQAVNPAFTEITGYAADEAVGHTPAMLRSSQQEASFFRDMWESLLSEGRWQGELWNRRKNGEAYFASLTISSIRDDAGKPVRHVGMFHDITALRQRDAQIRHLAFHDALTGLPNRSLIDDRLEHALARASRTGGCLALAFVDLDGFKVVNDTLGHDIGDLLLKEVASRIRTRLRAMDTVARLGGDEFLILMEDVGSVADCETLAQDVIATIGQPVTLRGQSVKVGASVGVAMFPKCGGDSAQLTKAADTAMYAAKAAGRNTYCLADPVIVPPRDGGESTVATWAITGSLTR